MELPPPSNSNYIQKSDIIEVLQTHIRKFDWKGEQTVLDVGCGHGEVTKSILLPRLPKQATLIGFDESKEKIEYAKKFRKDPRLSFNQIDIQYVDLFFNWKWNYFNKIFSFYCINWMQNYRRSLSNMYSLLKNNGDIVLIFLSPDNPVKRAFDMLKGRPSMQRLFCNRTWFIEARDPVTFIRTMLEEIGFKDVCCYQKLSRTTYSSMEAYLDLIEAVNPYLRDVSEQHQSLCMKHIKSILGYDCDVNEVEMTGEVVVNYKLVFAVAKKKEVKQDEQQQEQKQEKQQEQQQD